MHHAFLSCDGCSSLNCQGAGLQDQGPGRLSAQHGVHEEEVAVADLTCGADAGKIRRPPEFEPELGLVRGTGLVPRLADVSSSGSP